MIRYILKLNIIFITNFNFISENNEIGTKEILLIVQKLFLTKRKS